jgi:hypothetical protein
MGLQIDQSGKIEDTTKDTVIAFSNSISESVFVSKKIKRQVQEYFRKIGKPELFVDKTFSIVIYYLICNLKPIQNITIDLEYPGRDKFISSIILDLLKANKKLPHDINFARIGNKPKAHYAAKNVFDKKKEPTKILSLREILSKQKDRWVFKRMYFNPGRHSGPGLLKPILPKKRKMSR